MTFGCYITDWSQALCRFLKDQLVKIMEHHQGSAPPQTSFLTAANSNIVDIEAALKYWNYCTQLGKHLYDVRHYSNCQVV